ncbi:MAG: DNA-protecting protein DprA [Planctomycetes bacterium]|nr:DNA-protecting protein DprA [Planctomycetota bacterium]
MTTPPDPNTQAILLLTAPLRAGASRVASEPLSLGEYNALALALHENGRTPSDLLGRDAQALLDRCRGALDGERLRALLARGFALAQAWDEWQARGIWVVSRAESRYPKRLRDRLERSAPPVLFGCGELTLGERGGLAIVGSRSATDDDLAFARANGALAASAGRVVVSGGARGVDTAAMQGALDAGGSVVGVLADGLARAAVDRSHRDAMQSGRLLLLSTADPAAAEAATDRLPRRRFATTPSGLGRSIGWGPPARRPRPQPTGCRVVASRRPRQASAAPLAGALRPPESSRRATILRPTDPMRASTSASRCSATA